MANKDEIKKILKMLEENKITSLQASKLLQAMEVTDEKETDTYDVITDVMGNINDMSKRLGKLGARIGRDIMDGIKDTDISIESNKVDRYKFKVAGESSIKVSVNGKISIHKKAKDDDVIDVFISYHKNASEQIATCLKVVSEQGLVSVIGDQRCKSIVNVDMHLPSIHFNKVILTGSNHKIYFNGLNCELIETVTTSGIITGNSTSAEVISAASANGKITINDCRGEKLKVVNTNSSIELKKNDFTDQINGHSINGSIYATQLQSNQVNLSTTNGNVVIENSYCEFLKMISTNGNIVINKVDSKFSNRCEVEVVTNNGNINCRCNFKNGVVFDASADNGGILLAGRHLKSEHSTKDKNRLIRAIGKSYEGDRAIKYNDLKLKTFMGTIVIDWYNGGLYNG